VIHRLSHDWENQALSVCIRRTAARTGPTQWLVDPSLV
jgi:hypothetical protein